MKEFTGTATEFLQQKYEATDCETVTDWMSRNKVDLSLQSCTAVLLRGQTKGLQVMLTLAACLGCSAEELKWVAQQCGDRTLWKYIVSQGSVTAEELSLLEAFRLLNGEQKNLITSMALNLAPKGKGKRL